MARRGAQLERPVRPGDKLVLGKGRRRHDLEIGDGERALADGGADAVGAGVAAADHHDVLAGRENRLAAVVAFAAHAPVLLRQELHGEMDAVKLASRDGKVARLLGAAREHERVVALEQARRRHACAHIRAVVEDHAFRLHLCNAGVDVMLLHLEVGNAVAQQASRLGQLLENVHLVAGARELLRAGHARRTRADHGHLLSRAQRRGLRHDPAFFEGAVGDRAFDGLDGDGIVVEVERAGGFAWRRTDAAGDLGEIVGAMQVARRLPPVAAIDQIVPVRNLVVHGTAGVAVGNAAIHATRRLRPRLLLREWQHELAPVLDALLDRLVMAVAALVFEKAGDLAHAAYPSPEGGGWRPQAAGWGPTATLSFVGPPTRPALLRCAKPRRSTSPFGGGMNPALTPPPRARAPCPSRQARGDIRAASPCGISPARRSSSRAWPRRAPTQ